MGPRPEKPVVHLELHTSDLSSARDFYAGLLGWEPERVNVAQGTYLALGLGSGIGGGIVECRTERALWLPYADVPDVAEATRRAVEANADLLLAPTECPTGWRSVVATREAGEIALWQHKR